MRIGYLTVPPTMPDREELRDRILLAQIAAGYAFPNALLQHAIEDLEALSIDVGGARAAARPAGPARCADLGYEPTMPEGTFYVMARRRRSTTTWRSRELLLEEDVLVLPGTIVELPGWFRISLTASDEMVERSSPGSSEPGLAQSEADLPRGDADSQPAICVLPARRSMSGYSSRWRRTYAEMNGHRTMTSTPRDRASARTARRQLAAVAAALEVGVDLGVQQRDRSGP